MIFKPTFEKIADIFQEPCSRGSVYHMMIEIESQTKNRASDNSSFLNDRSLFNGPYTKCRSANAWWTRSLHPYLLMDVSVKVALM